MEPWKIGVILALVVGLGGYGLLQQKQDTAEPLPVVSAGQTPAPAAEDNKAARFIGQTLGNSDIPSWKGRVGPWQNTKAPIKVADLKGKPALVEFFRINCSHCQEAAPFLEALYRRYQPRGLKMAAIQSPADRKGTSGSEETNWTTVQGWIKERGLTYPIGFDKNSEYFQGTIEGTYYPTTMVTDANGKVVYAQTGHDDAKAIKLAVELEKQFPGPGTAAERGQELAKFVAPFLSAPLNPKLLQALSDDLAQRLEGKVAEE